MMDLKIVIRPTDSQVEDSLRQPIPNSSFPWSARLVDAIFQVSEDVEMKATHGV